MELEHKDWLAISNILKGLGSQTSHVFFRKYFCMQIQELIPYDCAIFDLSKIINDEFIELIDPVVCSKYNSSFEKKLINDLDSKYLKMSNINWIYYAKKNIVYRDSDMITPDIAQVNPFISELMVPNGFNYGAGCNLVYNNLCIGAISLIREERSGDFTERELFIIKQLQPHITNNLFNLLNIANTQDFQKTLIENYNITTREIEILELIFNLYENKEVSEILNISNNTVKKHINHIFFKLDVKSRSQLLKFLSDNNFYVK